MRCIHCSCKTVAVVHCRLEDDERLDKLLDQLERKVPGADSRQQQQAPVQPAAARPTGARRATSGSVPRQQVQSAGRARKPAGPAAAAAGIGLRSKSTGRDQRMGKGAAGAMGVGSRAAAAVESEEFTDDAEYSFSSVTGGDDSSTMSVKSGLAAELRAVRQQLEDLEARAGNKARRALAGIPAAARTAGARMTPD